MKKFNDVAKEFSKKCDDEDIKFLDVRLAQRIGQDVAEAVEFLQRHHDMDKWLGSATSADEFFDMLDNVGICMQTESKKRFGHEQATKQAKA